MPATRSKGFASFIALSALAMSAHAQTAAPPDSASARGLEQYLGDRFRSNDVANSGLARIAPARRSNTAVDTLRFWNEVAVNAS